MRKVLPFALATVLVVFIPCGISAIAAPSNTSYILDQTQQGTTEGHVVDSAGSCWQEFRPSLGTIARIDVAVEKLGAPGSLTATIMDAAGAVVWQTTIAESGIGSGWLVVPVQPTAMVEPGSSYYIHLSTESSLTRADQYLWYGRPDSGYDRGVSSLEMLKPGFDFAFRTWAVGAKPDLVVTDVWEDEGIIWCELMNQGEGVASGGHYTSLIINGEEVAKAYVRQDLKPGSHFRISFGGYMWVCTPPSDVVTVHADSLNHVDEINEANNHLTRTFVCDTSPLIVVAGPEVSRITEHTAVITWQTNRPAGSTVLYGTRPEEYETDAGSSDFTTHHRLTLDGLAPSTAYHYVVHSEDGIGGIITSKPRYFRTAASPDEVLPDIAALAIDRASGPFEIYRMVAQVSNPERVHRVEFFLGGRLVATDYGGQDKRTDYSAWVDPNSLGLSRDELLAPHDLRAVAHDDSGRFVELPLTGVELRPEPPNGILEIVAPHPEYTFFSPSADIAPGASIDIEVYAAEYEYQCLMVDSLVAPTLVLQQTHEPDSGTDDSSPRNPLPEWMPVFEPPTCRDVARAVQEVELFIDLDLDGTAELVDTWVPPSETRTSYTYHWNLEGLDHGRYYIVVRARLSNDTLLYDTRHVEIATEGVSLGREVVPYGNFYQISLTVVNEGSETINLDTIKDNLTSFQAIQRDGANYRVYTDYCVETQQCVVTIDFFTEDSIWRVPLAPGESVTASYLAVPIRQVAYVDSFRIGADDVIVKYDARAPYTEERFSRPVNPQLTPYDLLHGINSADYLIVTNPERLFAHAESGSIAEAGVNTLLSTMADLARWKNGVLGYLNVPHNIDVQFQPSCHDDVRAQIHAWGTYMRGSDGTPEGYLDDGYLLIVGEIEIVPSGAKKMNGRTYLTGEAKPMVPCTDMYYASTAGSSFNPQLKVGRIIGDTVQQLTTPIEVSLGVHRDLAGYSFDRSQALILSGWPRSRSGESDSTNFMSQATAVEQILASTGTESYILDATQHPTSGSAVESFFTNVPGSSIIHLAGHGNVQRCDDLSVWDLLGVADPLAPANPFVYASSCTTGQYHGEDISLAEGFLMRGAGAYLGSTNISYCCTNRWVAKDFYQRWTHGRSLGSVLRELKRSLGDYNWRHPQYGYYEDIWTAQYQLYGDPKYGRGPFSLVASQTDVALTTSYEPLTTLHVHVPEYTITTEQEGDFVQIPGGSSALMPGNPIVPVYDVYVDYPKGYRVQDVRLMERSAPILITGLNIPDFEPATSIPDGSQALNTSQEPGWWPEIEYHWGIDENQDGSSTLALRVNPFVYDAATTQAQFHQDYTFEIDVASSPLEIVSLTTDRHVYTQGEQVGIQLWLYNDPDASPMEVFIETVVIDEASGIPVDSLPLHMLCDVTGTAYLDLQWDSNGTVPDTYAVVVELKDGAGNTLDRSLTGFALGVHSAEMTSFLATPQMFDGGETVAIQMLIENTGSVDLTGSVLVTVVEERGIPVHQHRHLFADVAPGSTLNVNDAWYTPDDSVGEYRIIAAVLYSATATDPLAITVSAASDDGARFVHISAERWGLLLWVGSTVVLIIAGAVTLMLLRRRSH